MIITIDGPSGSGKSTLSISLAKHLGFFCLNSGYLYRGLAYVLKTYYGYTDEMLLHPRIDDIQACIQSGNFRYEYVDGIAHIFFKDDISQFLKRVEIGQAAAIIAQHDQVRDIVQNYERALVADKDAVIEGRSGGSVVFAHAQVKLFVTASPKVRAHRMVLDQKQRGNNQITEQEALELIVNRDQKDISRKHDPLMIPAEAIILDTSDLTPAQTLDKAVEIIRKSLKK